MFILHNNKEQTYEEALHAMSAEEAQWFWLKDIAKRYWTEELLCSALRHGCGELSEIPIEKRTPSVCEAAKAGEKMWEARMVKQNH